jgi:hypothetical protein
MTNPDATTILDEAPAGFLTVQYAPANGFVSPENPPRFSWLPDIDIDARYALTLEPLDAPGGQRLEIVDISHNFYTPTHTLPIGRWSWHYQRWDSARARAASQPSSVRTFTINADAIECPGMDRIALFRAAPGGHPRLWLSAEEITQLRNNVRRDPNHIGWARFYERSVAPWKSRSPIAEPQRYPNDKRELALWRQMYIDCQEVIYGVRHQAIAGVVLDDKELRDNAKRWLLQAAGFNVRGSTARSYNDEAAFRIAAALAWGYDWLYEELSEHERTTVRVALSARLEEVAVHVIDHARIHMFPYDSHAVRALGMVIIPCCIALLGEHPRAQEWLDFAIAYYDTMYSPWGGADGGWAEGPHYWTTALAYFNEAANLLRKYTGHDVYRRAFFRNTGYFPLYTKSPDSARGCFGDDPTLGERPSLKVAYLLRDCAASTANGWMQWYFDQILANDTGTESLYYNYGWWSLPFDDLCFQHDHKPVVARAPSDLPELRQFEHIGWVAIQRRMHLPNEHVQLVTKSSRYGSISHSHGDQGAFTFFAYGEDLAIQSGYYIGHNTTMHRNWRRQTRSKNLVLIGGRGQYAGDDKAKQIQAFGSVNSAVKRDDGIIHISLDVGSAYRSEVPELQSYCRQFYLLPGDHLLVIDEIKMDTAQPIDWLLHTLYPPTIARRTFRVDGQVAGLTGEVVYCSSGAPAISTSHGFADVNPKEYEGSPEHHQLTITTPPSERQTIAVLLSPFRNGESNRLFHFIDDQGFAANLYFQDAAGFSFTVRL